MVWKRQRSPAHRSRVQPNFAHYKHDKHNINLPPRPVHAIGAVKINTMEAAQPRNKPAPTVAKLATSVRFADSHILLEKTSHIPEGQHTAHFGTPIPATIQRKCWIHHTSPYDSNESDYLLWRNLH